MKNRLYIFLLILFAQSCLNMTEPEQQADYIKSYKSFDAELVEHFPKKIPNNWTYISYGAPSYINEYSKSTGLILRIQIISNEKYERLKNQLKEEAKVIKNSTDSCFLIVDSEENQSAKICDNYYPIPQDAVYMLNDKNGNWLLQENCEIALINYKSGVFIESKYLTQKETMPRKWKNGYSKGYAFNNKDQTIMYWLIIW